MSPDAAKAMYRRALKSQSGPGEPFTLIRNGDARAYVAAGYMQPNSPTVYLPGSVVQNRRRLVLMAEDVTASGFPLPIQVNRDRIQWGSPATTNAVKAVAERRVQGVLIAYEIDLEGA